MFQRFFHELRRVEIPVSLPEYLDLLNAINAGLAEYDVNKFYYLSRTVLLKDERYLDKFDQVFSQVFKGIESLNVDESLDTVPEEWLKHLTEKYFSPEEMKQVHALGDWEKLMEQLKKRIQEQKKRHEGGNKWIGTSGTSPFGSYGFNPEGIRIGQNEGRNGRAVKVWDKRDFSDLDGDTELGTRSMKVALRRLRKFARSGNATELDIDYTVQRTAKNGGWLDLQMVPERHNNAKILLLLDVGGSMDSHTQNCEKLFSAAQSEFKHLEYFYFHNCPYEKIWRTNRRRHTANIRTWDLLNTYSAEYNVVMVGDALMSPYEIMHAGASVEHFNSESGMTWLQRIFSTFPKTVWLNPTSQDNWPYNPSIDIVRKLIKNRMFPLTIDGIDSAMQELSN